MLQKHSCLCHQLDLFVCLILRTMHNLLNGSELLKLAGRRGNETNKNRLQLCERTGLNVKVEQ